MPRQHRRHPIANLHPRPLTDTRSKAITLLTQKTWADAVHPIVKKRIQSMVGTGDPVLSQVSFLSTETTETTETSVPTETTETNVPTETSVPTETTETNVPNGDKCHSTRASCLGDRYPSLDLAQSRSVPMDTMTPFRKTYPRAGPCLGDR